MKKKIRLCMIHPQINNIDEAMESLRLSGEEPFELIWDNENPQYLVATEMIYEDIECQEKFLELYKSADILIYFAGECIAPDLNIFDYAVVFDRNLKCDDRVGRIPMREFYREYIPCMKNSIVTVDDARTELKRKDGFCNFIYSNPTGATERTEIFEILQSYKRVDALGRYLNNVGKPLSLAPAEVGWPVVIAESIEVKSRYKFSVAFENAFYAGYTSEKVFSSLVAHTIPIYWGNKYISDEVNEDAIINCHKFDSWEAVLQEVKRINENDELWVEKVRQPWLTDNQLQVEQEDWKKYIDFMENIFMQPIEKAVRRGHGTHPDRYFKWFCRDNSEIVRIKKNHDIEVNWLKKICSGESCADYFIENGYRKIAIYGMGDLGRCLYSSLKVHKEIEIVKLIDKNNPRNIPEQLVCKPEEIDDEIEIDVIVVSLPHLYEDIKRVLEQYTTCDIVSIADVVSDGTLWEVQTVL